MRSAKHHLGLSEPPLAGEPEAESTLLRGWRQREGVRASLGQRIEKLPRLRVEARSVVVEHGPSEGGGT